MPAMHSLKLLSRYGDVQRFRLMTKMFAVKLMLLAAGALALAASAACEPIPPSTALTDGPAVAAPAGWVDYCHRHDEDPGCRP